MLCHEEGTLSHLQPNSLNSTDSTPGARGFFLSFLISGSSRCDLFATELATNIVLFGIAIVWQCLVDLVQ